MVALVTGGKGVDVGAVPKVGFVSPVLNWNGPAEKGEVKLAMKGFGAVVLLGLVVVVGEAAFGSTFVAVAVSLSDLPMAA